MEQDEVVARLKEHRGRWVLVAGGRLSISSGVPLPTRRTRWSPSLADLVQHHIFRTQSREIFVNVEEAIQSGHPPLGFVADSLEGQQKWLDTVLAGLTPHTPVLRLADLAKAGYFSAILTDSFDGLLLRALSRVGVACKEISVTSPGYGEGRALPVLREWDDRAFLDTQDHRSRENDFVRARLAEMIDERSALLIVGQHAQWSDLNRAVVDALKRYPALPVLWIEEPVGAEEAPVIEWMAEHLGAFVHVKVPSLSEFVESLSTELDVDKTPLVAPAPAKETLFQRVMNTSFDVKPVLIFVPGVALLGGLLNQLPKMTVGKALSLVALAATVAGLMNYRERRAYFQQVEPVLDRVSAARKLLQSSRDLQGVSQSEAQLNQAEAGLIKVSVPAKSSFTFDALRELMVAHRSGVERDLRKVRDSEITPRLFLHRQRERIEADPVQEALGSHPALQVYEVTPAALAAEAGTDPRGIYFQGRPLGEYRVTKRLDAYRGAARVALLSPSALLLEVTLRKEILEDSKDGRIAVEVDMSRGDGGALEGKIFDSIKEVAGYVGERASLFRPGGVSALFQEGKCSLYFVHLDGAGVAGSMAKIDQFLAQYPRCRAVITAATREGEVQLARVAPSYQFLSAAEYPWPQALAYLREHTSPLFAEGVLENSLLRWNLTQPLVLSLLVDRYRLLGSAPRSLASVYDRLLSMLLARGGASADKRLFLGHLAHERLRAGRPVERRRALELAGKGDAGAAMLRQLAADGVLRSFGDIEVDFVDERILNLCAAARVGSLPAGERLAFLLRGSDDLLALHAGLDPGASELAGRLLADYGEVDGLLRKRNRHLDLLNPRLPLLRKAAWVVQNGEVEPGHVRHLESLLFELTRHRDDRVAEEATLALSTLSTPAVRRWVLDGIERDSPEDSRLLQIAARAPSDIYVGAILGWYRRLGTDADRRKVDRFKGSGGDGEGEFRTSEAVANAFSALAQSGTEDSLLFLADLASAGEDPRFAPEVHGAFRQHAARILLSNGRHELVRPLLPAITRAPGRWLALLPALYRLNDEAVVKALVDILRAPPAEDAASKNGKEYAAFALSRVDRGLALPPLTAFLQQRREGPPDALPYGALSLGYRGDSLDFPLVSGLVEDVLRRRAERPVDAGYTATLDRAVALFSSRESFALYSRLYDEPGWWGGQKNLSVLSFFKKVGAEEFVQKRLLCGKTSAPEASSLVQALGRVGTPDARQALDRLLRATDGFEDTRTLGQLCGDDGSKGKKAPGGWPPALRRGISLALVLARDDRDLPRLLRWAADPDPDVRRAALEELGHVRGAGLVVARETLVESLVRSPEDRYQAIRALGVLGSREAEGPLLSLFDSPDARADWIVAALEKTGGWAAFLKLYPMQGKASGPGGATPGAISSALFRIASRMAAEPLPVARFAGVIPG